MARRAIWAAGAVALLTACAAPHDAPPPITPAAPSIPTTTTHAPAAPPSPVERTTSWFDLDVGDCVAAVPAVDIGEVSTAVVDCVSPHQAEVYLREPTAVDTAVADVADEVCTAGLPTYAGTQAADRPLVATYLIDSNQDRTDNNPLPSTIICLLQSAGGDTLSGSAHR